MLLENKTHELKILPQYFKAVQEGTKTFEIGENDRGFKVGDTLILKEYEESKMKTLRTEFHFEGYTGREITKEVNYVLEGGQYGLEEGYCILGLKAIGKEDILNELIEKYGMNAKMIQETYERYMWSINYYKNSIKLKNIDLTGISKEGQLKKIFEEFSEVFNAIENESDEEVAAETLDLIQAVLGYVHKTRGVSANYIMEQYPKHLEKLKNRPRD